eukprot:CAMPEP_0181168020 /NCGR_PEP_ID=MMETSP1096-20121128/36_1 /TAXON_ID=156174 ORGANISM="Chrysochromulina ericina, Strain CCMP281" /NCGR_SAMPLE_ID=MMETSP1096 /ASSEMBLY_ACC=CAM_ASM_000453 /LENGTH=138 /DNA_ID=CAMNT_0023255339 /DNA_START=490 /DNA_END=903 /DNA_ORIENTATION=-
MTSTAPSAGYWIVNQRWVPPRNTLTVVQVRAGRRLYGMRTCEQTRCQLSGIGRHVAPHGAAPALSGLSAVLPSPLQACATGSSAALSANCGHVEFRAGGLEQSAPVTLRNQPRYGGGGLIRDSPGGDLFLQPLGCASP